MNWRHEIRRMIIKEIRNIDGPHPVETEDAIKIPELANWSIQHSKYDVEKFVDSELMLETEWNWDIMDANGELVGSLLEDGTLNYYDEEAEGWNLADAGINFKGKPKLAAKWIWLKIQKPLTKYPEEPRMALESEEHKLDVSAIKARDGFVRTDAYEFPDVDGYKVFVDEMTPETARKGRYVLPFKLAGIFDSKNNYVGHVAVSGTVYYTKPGSDTLQLKTHLKVKFDENGLRNAARLIYLTRQKPLTEITVAGKTYRDRRHSDIGGYKIRFFMGSATIDGRGMMFQPASKYSSYSTLSANIYDENNLLVGQILYGDTLTVRGEETEDGVKYRFGPTGYKVDINDEKSVKNAVRYTYLRRQKPLKAQQNT